MIICFCNVIIFIYIYVIIYIYIIILFAHLFNIDQAFSDGGSCTNAHLLKHVVLLKPEAVQAAL